MTARRFRERTNSTEFDRACGRYGRRAAIIVAGMLVASLASADRSPQLGSLDVQASITSSALQESSQPGTPKLANPMALAAQLLPQTVLAGSERSLLLCIFNRGSENELLRGESDDDQQD